MEASTTPPIEAPQVDIISSDIMLPLENSSFSFSEGSSTTIDTILTDYFSIFPTSYFLLLIAIGISAILIYTLYGYLENL
jgi:hypothetical protein